MILKYYDPVGDHKHIAYPCLRVNNWLLVLVEGGEVEPHKWHDHYEEVYSRGPKHAIIPFYNTSVGLELLKVMYPDLRNYL